MPACAPAAAAAGPALAVATTAVSPALDDSLVGRRVEALWADPDDESSEPQWFLGTIVTFRPRAKKWKFVLHFDDGQDELISLPDDSVRFLPELVHCCRCERCRCTEEDGRALPLPYT